MLNKKSLAVALMGLGLAGSCFAADTNSVTVNFTATVQLGTCTFAVEGAEGGTSTDIAFTGLKVNDTPAKQSMAFTLTCVGARPFNTAKISGYASAGEFESDGNLLTSTGGKFVFYDNEDDDTSTWNGKDITWDELKVGESGNTVYTVTKWVGYDMGQAPEVKVGTHEASVVYTVSYE